MLEAGYTTHELFDGGFTAAQLKSAGLQADEADGKGEPRRDTLSLLTKIIYNLQFSFRNIHVRYEDRTHSSAPFAIGATLAELSAHLANHTIIHTPKAQPKSSVS